MTTWEKLESEKKQALKNIKKLIKLQKQIDDLGIETFKMFKEIDKESFNVGREIRNIAEKEGINIFRWSD